MSDSDDASPELPELSFAEFLEESPPSSRASVIDFAYMKTVKGTPIGMVLSRPDLQLHCSNTACNGVRTFRVTNPESLIGDSAISNLFTVYLCSNCRQSLKVFALRYERPSVAGKSATVVKLGEDPPFGPVTPARLLRLLQDDRDIFLKGRRCENQGLGVGAFAYYRRAVENQRNRIFDKIIEVSRRLNAEPEAIAELQSAKKEHQFKAAIEHIKHGLPQALLIDGHNPLTLLHTALSDGLHDRSDDYCLELATSIRVVLADLSERIAQVTKDERELKHAVSRLLAVKSATGANDIRERAENEKPGHPADTDLDAARGSGDAPRRKS